MEVQRIYFFKVVLCKIEPHPVRRQETVRTKPLDNRITVLATVSGCATVGRKQASRGWLGCMTGGVVLGVSTA